MRNSELQLEEILRRADTLRRKKASRRAAALSAASVFVCLALIVGAASLLSVLPAAAGEDGVPAAYGSLILSSSFLGYIVIGVLAFALGVCVTLLCRALRASKEKEDRRDQ